MIYDLNRLASLDIDEDALAAAVAEIGMTELGKTIRWLAAEALREHETLARAEKAEKRITELSMIRGVLEDDNVTLAQEVKRIEASAAKLHAAFGELLSYFNDNGGDWYMYDPKIDGDTMAQWRALLDEKTPA